MKGLTTSESVPSEIEDEHESVVDSAQLADVQAAG
jgi:hypothetical protein